MATPRKSIGAKIKVAIRIHITTMHSASAGDEPPHKNEYAQLTKLKMIQDLYLGSFHWCHIIIQRGPTGKATTFPLSFEFTTCISSAFRNL